MTFGPFDADVEYVRGTQMREVEKLLALARWGYERGYPFTLTGEPCRPFHASDTSWLMLRIDWLKPGEEGEPG